MACGDGSVDDSSDGHSEWRDAVVTLCAAARHAETDRRAAEDLFMDQAHDPLHEIADAVSQRDRRVAARLLEAKNLLELRFEMTKGPSQDEIEELARRTDIALEVLDIEPVGCVENGDR
jgi:hypothetical protein